MTSKTEIVLGEPSGRKYTRYLGEMTPGIIIPNGRNRIIRGESREWERIKASAKKKSLNRTGIIISGEACLLVMYRVSNPRCRMS